MKISFFYLRIWVILFFTAGIASCSSAQAVTGNTNDTIFIFQNDSLISHDDILWGRMDSQGIVYSINNSVVGKIDQSGKYYDSEMGEFGEYDPSTGNIILADGIIAGNYTGNELRDQSGTLIGRFSGGNPHILIGLMLFYFR